MRLFHFQGVFIRHNYLKNYYERKCPIQDRGHSQDVKEKILNINKEFKNLHFSYHNTYAQKQFPELSAFLILLGFDLSRNVISQKTKKTRNTMTTKWTELKTVPYDDNCVYVTESRYNKKENKYYEVNIAKSKIELAFYHIFSDCVKTNFYYYSHRDILESTLSAQNVNKINNNVGAYVKDKTDVFVVDIDNHDGTNTLRMLEMRDLVIMVLGIENLIFQEMSQDYGFHLYFKLDRPLTYEGRTKLLKYIQKKIGVSKKHLQTPCKVRFPLSYDYTALSCDSTDICAFENNTIEAINKTINKYENCKGFDASKYATEESTVKEKFQTLYKRTKVSSIIKKMGINEFLSNPDYDVYEGESYEKACIFVYFAVNHNMTEEECYDLMQQKNKGSKDLTNNPKESKKRIKFLYKKFDSSKCNIIPAEALNYISNKNLIPEKVIKLLSNKKVIKHLIMFMGYKDTIRNRRITEILLIEIIGKFYYNIENPKELQNKNLPEKLLVGEQFSLDACNLLKTLYNELKNVNVYKRVSDLLKFSGIFSQFFSNKRGYFFNSLSNSKGSCRQFILRTNGDNLISFSKETLTTFILTSFSFITEKFREFKGFILSYNSKINYMLNIFLGEFSQNKDKVVFLNGNLENSS